ncbi:hypothetical protein PR048_003509 [Dryococelus australis]|uniref:Fatty acid synthase n=1 Tax=Dryococelus australis TaxID=614101 RepID=A0ABQ9IPK6_9NEOP|nr:hypothetical protein PR048_003509 [Dryococelus australis]
METDDRIVISGIAGRLPESSNVEEFSEQLFSGVDLVTEDGRRWTPGLYGVTSRTGKLKTVSQFDASFFGVHSKQVDVMDPQTRMVVETSYESIVDAGKINMNQPQSIRGSRTGVFVGVSETESIDYWCSTQERVNGYGLVGCCRAMVANRVSYSLDLRGPSYSVSCACSSGIIALQQAFYAIQTDECDAAIVAGVNVCLNPVRSLEYQKVNKLSPSGFCKVFDESCFDPQLGPNPSKPLKLGRASQLYMPTSLGVVGWCAADLGCGRLRVGIPVSEEIWAALNIEVFRVFHITESPLHGGGGGGGSVAERLDCSPVTKANRVRSPAGPIPAFRKWEWCPAMPLVGDGYVQSEAIVTIFIQRSFNAKRSYATILSARTNADGYKIEGIISPSVEMQKKLIREVYSEAGIKPAEVSYVEANGTGVKKDDREEANAIAEIFCANRSSPLLVGSVKSNVGHTESASGLTALLKVLLSMEKETLPPNLHFHKPISGVPAFVDGRLKVVDKLTSWNGGLAAINSFGFGGSNVHVLLERNSKSKNTKSVENVMRIVTFSGRTEQGVCRSLEKIEKMPVNDEFINLLHSVHRTNIPGHNYRGFALLGAAAATKEVSSVLGHRCQVPAPTTTILDYLISGRDIASQHDDSHISHTAPLLDSGVHDAESTVGRSSSVCSRSEGNGSNDEGDVIGDSAANHLD